MISHFPIVDSPDSPAWERRHADSWRAFLASDTGQRLRMVLNYQEQAGNRIAVLKPTGSDRACGYAAGWSQASAFILHSLAKEISSEDEDPASDSESTGVHSMSEAEQPGRL